MATPNLVLEIEDEKIVRTRGNRKTTIARFDTEAKTIYWKDEDTRDGYHKSVTAFLSVEKIPIDHTLIEGQKPDVVPKSAPPAPAQHPMQGDLTPEFLDWEMKYMPISFQNRMGVKLKKVPDGGKASDIPSDNWVRADVVRTYVQPVEETKGGEYSSIKFKQEAQIIARRKSHITFEEKEIFKGDKATDQVVPFSEPYSIAKLEKADKLGQIEIVSRKHGAGSAGASF